ncbi:MAG: hypothetical protein WD354_06420 [Acidimicrobiia bacterium]
MIRRIHLLAVALLVAALPAVATEVSDIGDQLLLRGYYVESGADASIDEMEQLVASHPAVNFVALAGEAEGGADSLAAELLVVLETGTVIVVTPTEAGVASSEYDDLALSDALDAASGNPDATYSEYFEEFAEALPAIEIPPPEVEPDTGGFPIWAVVVVILVGLIGFTVWRGNRQRQETAAAALEAARSEIRQQMDVVANQIVEMADDPRVAENVEAMSHYRLASETFQAAETRLASATTVAQFEDLSDDLDRARWELEAASALAGGKPVPPMPETEKPPHCFFDPTHGAGTEEAELKTSAGSQKVWVCAADADKLRRGEAPQPRNIPMGPQQVPAPRAPRSHGGMGLDWLDVFSVIVGGMGSGVPYDWGGQPQRRRGPLRGLPGFGRSGGSATASRPSSRPPRPKGRARRSR